MILMLTSSPCDDHVPAGVELPCVFDARNGFVQALRRAVQRGVPGLYVAADPADHRLNDQAAFTFAGCFDQAGLTLARMEVLDSRTAHRAGELIRAAGVIILGGGHVPTQQAFFEEIHLRDILACYDGLVMGISAGSMNAAETVYAQPEEPGEATDPRYRRFLPGLALTRVNILPHYQLVKDHVLDGLRLFEDVTFGDSFGHVFHVLPDGSYILVSDGATTLHGEGWVIRDGRMERLCGAEESVVLA